MSGGADEDDRNARAGEYVLGLGSAAERRVFALERATDPAIDAAVTAWERRMAPLLDGFAPVSPPAELAARIERSAAGLLAKESGRGGRWWTHAVAGAAGFALAASLADVMVRGPETAQSVAVLLPRAAGAPLLVALRDPAGRLTVRAVERLRAVPATDYELWSLAAGGTRPVPLGVLRGGELTLAAGRVPPGQLLVSLEPSGGSPTGQPTGPVVAGGTEVESSD